MGWSIGYDNHWRRDIGYGVPAYCDHPKCNAEIDRGLAYVCGGGPYGENEKRDGCGLYFCYKHLNLENYCPKCARYDKKPYKPKTEHPEWIKFKATDPSWAEWRKENQINP